MKAQQNILWAAVLLMAAGVILTLENFGLIRGMSHHWPIAVLGGGGYCISSFFGRGHRNPVLIWLGTFLTVSGAFFYYLNYSGWSCLVRLWPAFPGIVGLAFLTTGLASSRRVLLYIGVGLGGLFAVFTLVFALSPKLWPLSLFVTGGVLLILEVINRRLAKGDWYD